MCYFKDSLNFFIQSLPLHKLRFFSVLLNDDIVDIEKLMEYAHPLMLWMNFQGYFYIHQSFLLNNQDLHKY